MVYPLGHRWTQTPAAPVLWHSSLTLSLNQIYHITKMTNLFQISDPNLIIVMTCYSTKQLFLNAFLGYASEKLRHKMSPISKPNYFFLAFLTFNGSTATPSSTRAASQASIKERTTCRTEIAHMTRMMDFQKLNGYKNVENHS